MHRKRKTKSLLLFFLLASAAITGSPAIAHGSPDEQALLQQANQARAQHNLPALRWDNALAAAARNHLRWVLRTPTTFNTSIPANPTSSLAAPTQAPASALSRRTSPAT